MKIIRCKNNEKHTISYCHFYGYYCNNCKCGEDKNLIVLDIEKPNDFDTVFEEKHETH